MATAGVPEILPSPPAAEASTTALTLAAPPFLTGLTVFCLVAGVLGIVGGMMQRKTGGVAMLIACVLVLIGASLFAILPFTLLLVGGIFSIRESNENNMRLKRKTEYMEYLERHCHK